jgi:hypothetical protein
VLLHLLLLGADQQKVEDKINKILGTTFVFLLVFVIEDN